MKLRRLNKQALSVRPRAEEFLRGITSNDLDRPGNAFLNIHGKIIAVFDQCRIGDGHFLMLIEQPFVDDVLKHLDRYMKLSKTSVEKEDFRVYFDLQCDYKAGEGEYVIAQKAGQLVVTRRPLEVNVSEEEFLLFRLKNGIAVQGVDFRNEFLLNVGDRDFVSFTKGCYLGQEPVSKVHSRSRPTWKLCAKYEDDCTAEEKSRMTSKALDPDSSRVMGFVFVKNTDDRG